MARNWYSETMDILDGDNDFFQIVRQIAKRHPKMVVDAASIVSGKSWQEECQEISKSQGKIHAIKRCRELTKMSLLEAKNAVEAL